MCIIKTQNCTTHICVFARVSMNSKNILQKIVVSLSLSLSLSLSHRILNDGRVFYQFQCSKPLFATYNILISTKRWCHFHET